MPKPNPDDWPPQAIHGLADRPDLNGKRCVVRVVGEERITVETKDGKQYNLQQKNLVPWENSIYKCKVEFPCTDEEDQHQCKRRLLLEHHPDRKGGSKEGFQNLQSCIDGGYLKAPEETKPKAPEVGDRIEIQTIYKLNDLWLKVLEESTQNVWESFISDRNPQEIKAMNAQAETTLEASYEEDEFNIVESKAEMIRLGYIEGPKILLRPNPASHFKYSPPPEFKYKGPGRS